MKEIIGSVEDSSLELIQVAASSFESIRSFCDEYRSNYNSLDILIRNAAYFNHGEKNYHRLEMRDADRDSTLLTLPLEELKPLPSIRTY